MAQSKENTNNSARSKAAVSYTHLGSTDYAGDGLCVLTNLERATETKMGDQVITTGLGGVFPPDLLVGTCLLYTSRCV